MGNKVKLSFSFKNTEPTSSSLSSSWLWPSCGSPKTQSFRAGPTDIAAAAELIDTPPEEDNGGESTDTVLIQRLRSEERLFFEPGETNSILEEAKKDDGNFPFKESSVAIAIESQDPYVDFKRSMEEMVEAHGLKDWECLEELLSLYLRVNGKDNHRYIVKAFVDLLVSFSTAFGSSSSSYNSCFTISTTNYTPTSPLSFSCSTSSTTSHCLSSVEEVDDEIEKTVDNGDSMEKKYVY